jgi:hypothetical protein
MQDAGPLSRGMGAQRGSAADLTEEDDSTPRPAGQKVHLCLLRAFVSVLARLIEHFGMGRSVQCGLRHKIQAHISRGNACAPSVDACGSQCDFLLPSSSLPSTWLRPQHMTAHHHGWAWLLGRTLGDGDRFLVSSHSVNPRETRPPSPAGPQALHHH